MTPMGQDYVEAHQWQINKVVVNSAKLQTLTASSNVSKALRQSSASLADYIPLVNLYAASFDEAVNLVADLEARNTGTLARLEQDAVLLQEVVQSVDDPALIPIYWEMRALEKEYLLTRQASRMTAALKLIAPLRQAI